MSTQQILLASGGAGGGLANPFVLQLDSTQGSVGDTTGAQSNWWGSQTYDNTVITNIGQEQYQGFYAFTLGKACTISATLGGAGGWKNCRGRSIRSDFALAAGTRVVFFAGKMGVGSGQEGSGGGASCLMTYVSGASSGITVNGFTPLIIAAGGGEGSSNAGTTQELSSAAPPLSVTSQSNINSTRNTATSGSCTYYSSTNDYAGGVGRPGAQGGGSGWKSGAMNSDASALISGSVGLAYGAVGNVVTGSNAQGGFGGGGYGMGGNYYGAGGGGLYGGFEGTGCTGSTTTYEAYTPGIGNTIDNRLGALSYADPSGNNTTDNGLWGNAANYRQTTTSSNGRVYLSFT
tara:strand:- start:533 stop:1573 length:1041 start_codon:yes stop_codon:yes gene_type:complete